MLKIEPVSEEAMNIAVSIEKDIPSRITGENRVFIRAVIARAITAAVAAEREAWLDAANVYMTETYGNSALGNPIDRARIRAIRSRVPTC